MKKSNINFTVELDDSNVPEKITWDADDKGSPGPSETKAISIGLWDHFNQNTLRIDLWAKDMPMEEMKKFYVDCIGGLAQSILSSTGDEYMAGEMNTLCDKLVQHLQQDNKS
ncbi:MAG: gliding motility protein GldC [Bacteroidota bacterium]